MNWVRVLFQSVVTCPSTSLLLALRLDGDSLFSLSRSRTLLPRGVADHQSSAVCPPAYQRRSVPGSSMILT